MEQESMNRLTLLISLSVLSTQTLFFLPPIQANEAGHFKELSKGLSVKRKTQLAHMVKQDCGSCHGMTLKGGLGPPLLPDDVKEKPLLFLQNTILYGRTGTAMPPWKTILTKQEVQWISQGLQEGTFIETKNNLSTK